MWCGREGLLPVEFPWVEGSGGREGEGGRVAWPARRAGTPSRPTRPSGQMDLSSWRDVFFNLKISNLFSRRGIIVLRYRCAFFISGNMMEMGLFTAAACRVLFTLRKEVSTKAGPVRVSARVDFAAAATRVRADRLPPATLPFCPHILDKSQ